VLSNSHAGALLTSSVGGAPVFLALLGDRVTREDTGTTIAAKEVSYGGYERVEVDPLDWGAPSGSRISNVNPIALAECTSGQSQVLGWALCDAATDGEMLWYGVVTPFIIDLDDPTPILPAGQLVLAFTSPVP
jgi:hypothetical protein